MRFTIAAAVVGLASVATASVQAAHPAHHNGTYTTEVVTSFTTFCPEPTEITHNGETYTVTSATTLTITNCPCTVTKPVYSSVWSSSSSCPPSSAPSQPPVYTSSNATAPIYTPKPTGGVPTPVKPSPSAPAYTGAADKASFGVAGLLAAAGLIAAL